MFLCQPNHLVLEVIRVLLMIYHRNTKNKYNVMWHPFDAISFDRIIFSYLRCRYLLEVTDKLPVVYYDYKALVLHRRSVCFVPCAAGRSHSDWQTSTTIAKAPNPCFMSLLVSVLSGGTAVHLSSFINDTSKSVGKNMHFFVFCWFPLFSFGLNLLLQEVEPNSVRRYFVSRLQKSPYFCVFKYTVRKNSS